jgi:hypothetical protein
MSRTGKLCGAWTRLPRKYRKFLRWLSSIHLITVFFIVFHLTINKVFVIGAMPSGSASKFIIK